MGHEKPIRSGPPPSSWIAGPAQDLSLIVGTPLLILPAMLLARSLWTETSIVLFVAAFGQLGHNLPGMMRAYGDRALFRRFPIRFVVAPAGLLLLCVIAVVYQLHGLILVSAVWAIWHALMQTFGFVRIYDAKMKSFNCQTRWLDFAITLTWFGGAIVLCDRPTSLLLTHFYNSGGPALPASALAVVRCVWLAALVIATLLFLFNTVRQARRREPISSVKISLLIISIAFYWYAYAGAAHILVGAAMFEVFHDVQYLTIVWLFNRKRAQSDQRVGTFTRFVFGRSGALVGVYLGLIFAFGSLRYVEDAMSAGLVRDVLAGFIAAMGLLHYYYDGFIWKVREPQTRATLELAGSAEKWRAMAVPRMTHVAKWALFVIPLGLLGWMQVRWEPTEQSQLAALAATFPQDVSVQFNNGQVLESSRLWQPAAAAYRRAIQLAPDMAQAHLRLGVVLRHEHRLASSEMHLRHAVRLIPTAADARIHLARTLVGRSKPADAERELEAAVRLAPESFQALSNLGIVRAMTGKLAAAETAFRAAVELSPQDAGAHFNLANVLRDQGKLDAAAFHLRCALEADPRFAAARQQLRKLENDS